MFNGWLIRAGGTEIPIKYIQEATYNVTPDQRQDLDSEQDVTGVLHRNVVEHTRSKVEFTTPSLDNSEVAALTALFRNAFTDASARTLQIEYYHPETDSYGSGIFYMPDTAYPIRRITTDKRTVLYNPIRYAFIEY